jgi:hypothetical protein
VDWRKEKREEGKFAGNPIYLSEGGKELKLLVFEIHASYHIHRLQHRNHNPPSSFYLALAGPTARLPPRCASRWLAGLLTQNVQLAPNTQQAEQSWLHMRNDSRDVPVNFS